MHATPSQFRRPIIVDHTVDFGDDITITFRFDRNKITDAWLREWTRMEDEKDVNALNVSLADLIDSWDMVGDDGAAFPPTVENISYLFTIADKAFVIGELMKASVPTRAEGNASANISATADTASTLSPASPPNGLPPSPSPSPSAVPSLT
jgi:hypothetical protein